METNRLEAFSDGVFAIAVTLLILEVRLPEIDGAPLSERLVRAWPGYLGFVISFVTIGIMWANHHSIFGLIHRTSHGLVVANLALLLCVSFLPFSTKVLGEHLRMAGADQRTATIFYSGSFFVSAVFYNLLWQTAARKNRLIVPGCEAEAAEVTRRFRPGAPIYLMATLAALWSVHLSLAIDTGLALLYLLPRPARPAD
ncbi:MAG: TMEM175 family protein [Acidimicrobiales bacterium]